MTVRPRLEVVPPHAAVRRRLCVVAGVDGSELSARVLEWCAGLGVVAAVEVVAVHALEARSYPPDFRRPLPMAADRSRTTWREEIAARIDAEWCEPLRVPQVRHSVDVGDGRPAQVLTRAAHAHRADLVVIGRRARGRLAEALRPGVVRVLSAAVPCPVVVVPDVPVTEDCAPPPPTPLDRVIVGCDGGEPAARALAWAATFAGDVGAELVAARVISPGGPGPAAAADGAGGRGLVAEAVSALRADLGSLDGRLPRRHRPVVLAGEAPEMLLALAGSESAGLVVLGVDARGRRRPRPGPVVGLLARRSPCPVVLVARSGAARDTGGQPSRRIQDMSTDAQRPRGVRFAAGTVVSPGEYRNCDTGAVRYFDGNTPLPGGVNSASWQQVSDHHHPSAEATSSRGSLPETASHPVRFAAGTVVSPGEYRNTDTGTVRFFDGSTPLPGGVNAASWQQVSDHHHPSAEAIQPEPRHSMPDTASRPVRFPAGTLVSPGEYRNCETGTVRYFDGSTPLPGGINAASWQQVSDHHHPQVPGGN